MPFYTDLRRRLTVVAVVVVLAGGFQILRISARTISTVLIQVPPTTHLLAGKSRLTVKHPQPRTSPTVPSTLAPVTIPPTVERDPANAGPAIAAPASVPGPRPVASPPTATPDPPPSPAPTRAPASPPPPVHPPSAGVYAYRYTVGNGTEDGTITVASAAQAGGETEAERVGGTTRTRTLDWSGGRVAITASDYGGGRCAWSPALTAWQLPLAVGARWHTHGACSSGAGTLTEDEAATVDGVVQTTVGGEQVTAWVIERTTTVADATQGVIVTTETQSTELFAPSVGLVVYADGRTATPGANGAVTTTDSALELLSLRPR